MQNSFLPIYFLVDTSDSMRVGDKIGLVNEALHRLLRICRENQHVKGIALVSIITFSDKASLLLPIAELKNCNPPRLETQGNTALGAAFDMLRNRLEIDNANFSNLFREPIAFLLTDGYPTDEYNEPLAKLKSLNTPFRAVAIGFGADVDFSVLRDFAPGDSYQMEKMTDNDFQSLFGWIGKIIEHRAGVFIHAGQERTRLTGKSLIALKGTPKQTLLSHKDMLMLPPPPDSLKKVGNLPCYNGQNKNGLR